MNNNFSNLSIGTGQAELLMLLRLSCYAMPFLQHTCSDGRIARDALLEAIMQI